MPASLETGAAFDLSCRKETATLSPKSLLDRSFPEKLLRALFCTGVLLCFNMLGATSLWAQDISAGESAVAELRPWSFLASNAVDSFSGSNALFHLAGAGATYGLASSGADWRVHSTFQEHGGWGKLALPAVILDGVGPLLLTGGLYAGGSWGKNTETLVASYAVLQASALTLAWVSVLKGLTGRVHPDEEPGPDNSTTFRFGLLRGGIFWGWPSGHTAMAMSMASSLSSFYPNSQWLKLTGYAWVAYTMFSVSAFEHGAMHWFSDAVAGALMSYAISSTVGKRFRAALESPREPEPLTWMLVPGMIDKTPSIQLLAVF